MPTVPLIRRQVSTQALPNVRQNPNVPAEAFGGGAVAAKVANAAEGALDVVSKIYQQEKQKADETAATDKWIQVKDFRNESFWNPKTGAMTRRGKDSFAVMDEYLPQFDKFVEDQQKDLSNDDQREMFRKMAMKERSEYEGNLRQHVFKESETYYEEVHKNTLETNYKDAVLNYNVPGKIKESLTFQDQKLEEYGARKGWDGNTTRNMIEKAHYATHKGVMERMMDNGQDLEAKKYFEENRADIKGDVGDIEKNLRASSIKGESQRLTDSIMARGMSETDAMNHVKALAQDGKLDPETRAATEQRVRQSFNDKASAMEADQKRLYLKAQEYMKTNPGKSLQDAVPVTLLNKLTLEQQDALGKFAGNAVNDDSAWLDFLDKSAGELASMDRATFETSYWSKFDKEHRHRAESLWDSSKKSSENNPKLTNVLSGQEQLKNTVTSQKLFKADSKDWSDADKATYAALEMRFQKELENFEQGSLGGKRTATSEERQKVIDGILLQKVMVKGWFSDTEKPAALINSKERASAYVRTQAGKLVQYVPMEEIPETEKAALQRRYQASSGRPMPRVLMEEAFAAAQAGDVDTLNKILRSK